jgi:hypothetical protein
MTCLYEWKKVHVGLIPKMLKKCRRKMEDLMLRTDNNNEKEKKRLDGSWMNSYTEKSYCGCNSTAVAWLKEGDRNTCYFHRKATWRMKSKIQKLKTR